MFPCCGKKYLTSIFVATCTLKPDMNHTVIDGLQVRKCDKVKQEITKGSFS